MSNQTNNKMIKSKSKENKKPQKFDDTKRNGKEKKIVK